jgi:hypothetical protein
MINDTGRYPVATEDLVGMTLGKLIQRDPNQGYKLLSMLTFAPARNDWNVPSAETHVNDVSGQESDYYCKLTYAVVDCEGFASDDPEGREAKEITIQVLQVNDQPTDTVLQDESQSATLIGYEDSNLFIRFDASDVEDDDFTLKVVSCNGANGTYYLPSAAQPNHIDENGQLDTSLPIESLFDTRGANAGVDCTSALIEHKELLYSDTDGKGWYLLFVPNADKHGQDFSYITVAYDDDTVLDQEPQKSDRFIDIRSVNDAPVVYAGDVDASTINTPFTVSNGMNINLNLNFDDIDATTTSGDEFNGLGFQIRVSAVDLQNPDDVISESFSYQIADGVFLVQEEVIQPNSEQLGLVKWTGSISASNEFVKRVSVKFLSSGDYDIEVVVSDAGMVGYCTPDVELDMTEYASSDIRSQNRFRNGFGNGPQGYESSQCVRTTAVTVQFKATNLTAVIGGLVTLGGAGFLALVALGAVLFAKLKKPEDLDAWQALDNAQFANAQKSGIHEEATKGGQSGIYQGKK